MECSQRGLQPKLVMCSNFTANTYIFLLVSFGFFVISHVYIFGTLDPDPNSMSLGEHNGIIVVASIEHGARQISVCRICAEPSTVIPFLYTVTVTVTIAFCDPGIFDFILIELLRAISTRRRRGKESGVVGHCMFNISIRYL